MLDNQSHLFDFSTDLIYLNGAYMSPQLRSVTQKGMENLKGKSNPSSITESDFFSEKIVLKTRFAKLVDAEDFNSIAIIPSVSYGIAIAIKNIPFIKGDEIVILEEQFPSNFYAWKRLEKEKSVHLITIKAPPIENGRGQKWNEKILNSINSKTKCIAIPNIHWTDGTIFNLKAIREKANEVGAYLVIDGTQSVGALNFSVAEIKPDALICGGYKWLLGPYGLGVAYFGERLHGGTPLEDNWMNREGSEDFSKLVHYNSSFRPKSNRFDVGEASNFILTPMLSESVKQLLIWNPTSIQEYCQNISENGIHILRERGYFVEESSFRAKHLFGIYLPKEKNIQVLKERILAKKILVSFRGNAVRISPNVYNSKEEIEKLISCFI